MEVAMIMANIIEDQEFSMATRLMSGLNSDIAHILELQAYKIR